MASDTTDLVAVETWDSSRGRYCDAVQYPAGDESVRIALEKNFGRGLDNRARAGYSIDKGETKMETMTRDEMRLKLVTDPQVMLVSTGLAQMRQQAIFWENEVRMARERLNYSFGAQSRLDADVAQSEAEREVYRYAVGFIDGERDYLEHVSAMADLAREALADYAAKCGIEL